MKWSMGRASFALALLWASILPAVAAPRGQVNGETKIIVVGPRALRNALQILEQQIHCIITYEDPAYEHSSAVEQLFEGGPTIPQSHALVFAYNSKASTDKLSIIQALLHEYGRRDDTAVFKVLQAQEGQGIFNIVPVQSKNKSGQLVTRESPLDTTITLTANGTYQDIAGQIRTLVSQAPGNPPTGLDRPPTQAFNETKTSADFQNIAARQALNRLVNDYQVKVKDLVSWSLARDAKLYLAYLFFPLVPPAPAKLLDSVTLGIEAPRPLAAGTRMIEEELGQMIIYEDPPYLCSCQVMKNQAGQPQALTGGTLSFNYSSQADYLQIVKSLVQAQNDQGDRDKFAIKQIGNASYVYPTQFMTADDHLAPSVPVLETPISVSITQGSPTDVVRALASALAAQTKKQVLPGAAPQPGSLKRISYQAANKPAVDCLTELAKLMRTELSWQLLFDPRARGYVLNASVIHRDNHS